MRLIHCNSSRCRLFNVYLKWIHVNIIALLLFCSAYACHAQSEIALGTWRLHVSFNEIHSIAQGAQKVYGASANGVVAIDRTENSLTTYSKVDGLHAGGITALNYHNTTDQLLIAYADGKIDLIKNNSISTKDPTQNAALTGSKKINHISIQNNLAYFSADYGVVIFDLSRGEVKETWRDIGVGGETAKIFKSTFKDDSIFLATDKGVFAGDLRQNLLDYNFWKRFDTGDFSGAIQSVEAFQGKVYATVKDAGLYRYESGLWSKEAFLQNEPLQSLNSSTSNLLISSGPALWRLSVGNTLAQVISDKISYPHMAMEESSGQLWIADGNYGIVSGLPGNFTNYIPNGPSGAMPERLRYHNGTIYSLAGGYSSTFTPLLNTGNIDRFTQGVWSTQKSSLLDLTDIAFDPGSERNYLSSYGYGVELRDAENSLDVFDENNSTLINTNPPGRSVNVTSVRQTQDGIWVANYGASQSLHYMEFKNTWSSYSFPQTASRFPLELEVDFYDNVWLVPNPDQGGGVIVFDKEKNASAYLTTTEGSGGLPNRSVRSIAVDRDGFIWLGTDEGVCYFTDPTAVFSSGINAVRPIFEDRFLLRDDKVTAISVDGGNRKWMGTERGVWLFSPSGETLVYNFTAENSPLPSNVILDIEVNHETGEVFFATDQGLASFRSDATGSDFQFQEVKIFPNPVTPDFQGTVGITGLATDAIVKITDVSGKLVWQTQANGGTASWNIRDYQGRRATTGMYVVFATSQDGSESAVGKIAVVE